MAFLDTDGALLLEVPPAVHTVARFASFATQTRQLLDLRARAAKGDARASAALLIFQIEHRQLARAQVLAERARLRDETAPETQRLDELVLHMTISERIVAAGQDARRRRELGREFLQMLRAGKRPSCEVTRGFWFVICEHAEEQEDAAAYAEAVAGLRAQLEQTDPDAPWARTLIEKHTQVLARLRAATK